MTDRHISQSAVGDAEICVKRLEFRYRTDIPRTTSEARLVGTGYHGGLEAYYRARQQGKTPSHAAVLTGARTAILEDVEQYAFDAWETSLDHTVEKAETMVNRYFEDGHQWPTDHKILAVEAEFKVAIDLPGWVTRGFIDLVTRGPDGVITIEDHKTAGKPWQRGKESIRTKAQAPIYLLAWWLQTGEMGRFCYSVMTYDGRFERRWVAPTTPELAASWSKLKTTANLIENMVDKGIELPGNTGHYLCSSKFCDWWSRCPFGAAMSA